MQLRHVEGDLVCAKRPSRCFDGDAGAVAMAEAMEMALRPGWNCDARAAWSDRSAARVEVSLAMRIENGAVARSVCAGFAVGMAWYEETDDADGDAGGHWKLNADVLAEEEALA